MPVYIGLDCGGSSCRAVAVDESGHILSQGQAGPANLASTPPSKVQHHISKASREAPEADYVCGCFAGLLIQDDRRRAEDMLKILFPSAQVRAEPDFHAAYMACDDADLCVIAGTGSIVCSRTNGVFAKTGGRGYILGDVGSAFQYGRAAMLHYLNCGPSESSDALQAMIEDRFGSLSENEILAKLYRGGLPAAQLAKLSSVFAKDVRAGAQYAIDTLEVQTNALAKIVKDHIATHFSGRPEIRVALAGGLWEGSPVFRTAFEARLRETIHSSALTVMRITRPPVHGAVQLAKEMSK